MQAIRQGFYQIVRFPLPWVILYGVYSLVAGLLTLPLFNAINQIIGRRLIAAEMAQRLDLITLFQPVMSGLSTADGSAASNQEAATAGIGLSLLGLLVFAFILGPLVEIVVAGALRIYADQQFSWRRFAWGGWHWALPFIVFGLFSSLILSLVGILGSLGAIALTPIAGWAAGLAALLAVGVYLLLSAWFEVARVAALTANRRNMFWALGQAAKLLFRQPLRAGAVYLFWVALWLIWIMGFTALSPWLVSGWAVVAVAAEQGFIIGRLGLRLGRWAALTAVALPNEII